MSTSAVINKADIMHVIGVLYPNAHSIRHIEHGHENYIVIVDNRYVVRFPRTKEVWRRTKLEQFVLSKLNSPLAPKILRYSDNPAYLVQTFLPGKHLSEEEIRQLPIARQRSIGSQIAEFAYSLHNTLNVNEFKNEYAKLISQGNDDRSYGDYLREMLHDYTFPTEAQDRVAKQYFKAWSSIRPSKSVIVHDDLHLHNLLIHDGQLSGAVDFGATCIGTAEQELRQIYRLSNEALISAVETYNSLAHTKLDIETARIWATTEELATYVRELRAGHTSSAAFKRVRGCLGLWFSDIF